MNYLNRQGGVFTVLKGSKTYAFVRDKDMATLLAEMPSAVGFLGSDTYGELPDVLRQSIVFREIAATAIRYALACPEGNAKMFANLLSTGGRITVATSYSNALSRIAQQKDWCLDRVIPVGGSVEACANVLPEVDAIFDLVDTGNSLKDNGLAIVADNLGKLALGMAWQAN